MPVLVQSDASMPRSEPTTGSAQDLSPPMDDVTGLPRGYTAAKVEASPLNTLIDHRDTVVEFLRNTTDVQHFRGGQQLLAKTELKIKAVIWKDHIKEVTSEVGEMVEAAGRMEDHDIDESEERVQALKDQIELFERAAAERKKKKAEEAERKKAMEGERETKEKGEGADLGKGEQVDGDMMEE